jgi:hypothetical protein
LQNFGKARAYLVHICKILQYLQKYAKICNAISDAICKYLQIFARDLQKFSTRFAKICNAICENMQSDLRKCATRFAKICGNMQAKKYKELEVP